VVVGVVDVQNVDALDAKPNEARLDTAPHTIAAKIRYFDALMRNLPSHLGGEDVALARHARQRLAQPLLGQPKPIPRRGVEPVDARVERRANRLQRLLVGDWLIFPAQRNRPQS
jgi:hypothetical protein